MARYKSDPRDYPAVYVGIWNKAITQAETVIGPKPKGPLTQLSQHLYNCRRAHLNADIDEAHQWKSVTISINPWKPNGETQALDEKGRGLYTLTLRSLVGFADEYGLDFDPLQYSTVSAPGNPEASEEAMDDFLNSLKKGEENE